MAPGQRKRLHQVVDLTGDDDAGPSRSAKAPRLSAPGHSASSSRTQTPTPRSTQFSSQASFSSFSSVPPRPGPYTSEDRLSWQPPSQFDEAVLVDLTQVDDGPEQELYGSFDSKIVGVRYYNGYATYGEVVICRREPGNPYDSNAIRVDNVLGRQIGHIPRTVAAKLAPYLDKGEITIEAVLTGDKSTFECPIRVEVFGTSNLVTRADIEERLKKDRILTATQLKQTRRKQEQAREEVVRREMGLRNGGSTAGIAKKQPEVSMEELTRQSSTIQTRTGADFVKSMTPLNEKQLSKLPMAQQPAALLSKLLPYQLQGLAWLTANERPSLPAPGSDETVQLWKRDSQGKHVNIATNFIVKEQPKLVSGGILADDMGLGKTIQVISLIMTGGKESTLIVAPVSVMSNWEQQIQRHVLPEHVPEIRMHHGPTRTAQVKDLQTYDVVITSYGTLTSEAPNGPLFQMKWRRVVGHSIRNARTKAAEAACKLEADSRWVMTGTPIINSVRDFHSLLKFLRITGGIEQSEIFNKVVSRPLAAGDARAEVILQGVMRDLCLRRKKDMKFVDLKLPPKTEYKHAIEFWPDEKQKYDALLMEAKGALEAYRVQQGQFQSVLERLLRLRQLCNHWTLCKDRIANLMKFLEEQGVLPLTDKNRALLQNALQILIESQEECCVCLDDMGDPVITHCRHGFCRTCILQTIEIQHKCPLCRAKLEDDQLVEPAPEPAIGENAAQEVDTDTKSSKTEALLNIVNATLKKDGSKIIIFSQWTSFLNVIEKQLIVAGHRFTRIDGSMNATKRDAAILALDTDPNVRVMLASLAVCSVGLNLVSADTVILADSWWAPAIEDQAVDRVHRLGQTRPTTIWRLVMEGSVEERVLDIQIEKRKLVGKAFQDKKGSKNKAKETRMADVKKLLS